LKAVVVVFGLLAAIVVGVVALFTVGEAMALLAFVVVLGLSIYAAGWGAPGFLKGMVAAVLVLFVGGALWFGLQVTALISAFSNTDGPADPADPTALAAAQGKIGELGGQGGFRLDMSEEEIQAVIQDGLSDADSPLARVTIDIVDGDPQGTLDFVGEFKSGDLTVEGSVTAILKAGAVQVDVVNVDVGSLTLPGLAEGAIEDIVEQVSDLNTVLAEAKADVQSITLGNDRLVVTGTQGDGAVLTSADLLGALQAQAAAAGNAVNPPAERLGPGVINSTTADGPTFYVALGDSLAANVGVAQARDGYVSRVHNQLQISDGVTYGLRNFGISGETTGTLIRGSQLDDALAFMNANDISYVTIDIGANDLLGHLGSADCSEDLETAACQERLTNTFAAYEENMIEIFDALKDAAPGAIIIFMRAYNPFSLGFGSGVSLEQTSNETLDAFNDIAAALATERGILVADAFTPMMGTTAATTHMLDNPPDIHPLPIGYDVLGASIVDALG
jgi:lysophospholipase L1-like esterase